MLERRDGFAIPRHLPGSFTRHKNHANVAWALRHREPAEMEHDEEWLAFVRAARAVSGAGSRLLLTAEALSTVHAAGARLLTSTLFAAGFPLIRVVVVHRRLYDKLASVHSQRYMNVDLNVSQYLPIDAWIASDPREVRQRRNQTAALRGLYRALGAQVSVLRMDEVPQGSSLVREFVCEHVRAEHTCAHLKDGQAAALEEARANVRSRSVSPLFDLAYAAAKARGMPTLQNARAVVAALAEHDFLSWPRYRLPKRCLDDAARNRLFRATVEDERALASPAELTPEHLRRLRDDFASKSQATLCGAEVAAAAESRQSVWNHPLELAFRQAAVGALGPRGKPASWRMLWNKHGRG